MTIPINDINALFNNANAHSSDNLSVAAVEKEIKETGSALWQDAYSHREGITLGAAAIAGTAIALYAGRDQLIKLVPAAARLLPGAGKEVLLVEDTPFLGKAMKSALESNGERVTWVTGFKSANPLRATTLNGPDLIVKPSRFKVALVDGELTGSKLQGEHVVNALHADGVTSIGTSTVGKINDIMRANGAELTAQKKHHLKCPRGRPIGPGRGRARAGRCTSQARQFDDTVARTGRQRDAAKKPTNYCLNLSRKKTGV